MTEPREGLPCECFRGIARFDGRVAWWYSPDPQCPECRGRDLGTSPAERHHITGGEDLGYVDGAPACSTDTIPWTRTDDPDEAQAAFERGAEWVRTGEMA